MKAIFKRTTTMLCAAVMAVPMVFSANAIAPTDTKPGQYYDYASISDSSDYTLTIPASFDIKNSGWNEIGEIKAGGTLEEGKKLVVTATSENDWALRSGENEVEYEMMNYEDDSAPATSWEFTDLPASQSIGINVEDYKGMPAGNYTDTVTFNASIKDNGIPAETVTINNAPTEALFVNSTGTLTATVSPDNATDKTVVWSSSDPDYVSINAETGEYTVMGKKGYGSATITATATNGTEDTSDDVTATCTITGKVTYTSLSVGTVLHTGDTFYTGSTVYFQGSTNVSFTANMGVITIIEATKSSYNNKYYQCQRASNGTYPNWSYVVKDNTDGIYITGGSGTSSDKFTLAVHTK